MKKDPINACTLCGILTNNTTCIPNSCCSCQICNPCHATALKLTICPSCGIPLNKSSISNSPIKPLNHLPDTKEILEDVRVIKDSLVYVIGISPIIANEELLIRPEYMGQYGKILKCIVNKAMSYAVSEEPMETYKAYVTYSNSQEASIAILSIDLHEFNNHTLRASFGTTKYCSFFIKGAQCRKKDCLYLHAIQEPYKILAKEDINRHLYQGLQKIAFKQSGLLGVSKEALKSKMSKFSNGKHIFPAPDSIYERYRHLFTRIDDKPSPTKQDNRQEVVMEMPKEKSKLQHHFMFIAINDEETNIPNGKLYYEDINCYFENSIRQYHQQEDESIAKDIPFLRDISNEKYDVPQAIKKCSEFNCGKPLYFYDYQSVPSVKCIHFAKLQQCEWNTESYDIRKSFAHNALGYWIYEKCKKVKADLRESEKSTSSSAHSRKCSAEENDVLLIEDFKLDTKSKASKHTKLKKKQAN